MNSNRSIGNAFEREMSEILSDNGFWVHLMKQNSSGQPADLIAVKNHKAVLIDCKVCMGDRFPLSRVEENQALAMNHWDDCGNGTGWFALKVRDEIFMFSHTYIQHLAQAKSSLSLREIQTHGTELDRWLGIA